MSDGMDGMDGMRKMVFVENRGYGVVDKGLNCLIGIALGMYYLMVDTSSILNWHLYLP
jgi:hypothetical protein